MDTTTAHQSPLGDVDRSRLLAAGRQTPAHLGGVGEEVAARHLRGDHGLDILARNWRVAVGGLRGELDVVAVDESSRTLVVCEVKTRRDADRFGGAIAGVDPRKHRQLRRLTAAFLADQPRGFAHVRLDLVAIDIGRRPRLTHIVGLA